MSQVPPSRPRPKRLAALEIALLVLACRAPAGSPEGARVDPTRPAPLSMELDGFLPLDLAAQLPALLEAQDTAVALVVREADCFTCEDLGRQLRELARATRPRHWPLVVLAMAGDSALLAHWFRQERIAAVAMVLTQADLRLADGQAFATPAVLLVTREGTVIRGIAHPRRVNNFRRRSFTEELDLVAAMPP